MMNASLFSGTGTRGVAAVMVAVSYHRTRRESAVEIARPRETQITRDRSPPPRRRRVGGEGGHAAAFALVPNACGVGARGSVARRSGDATQKVVAGKTARARVIFLCQIHASRVRPHQRSSPTSGVSRRGASDAMRPHPRRFARGEPLPGLPRGRGGVRSRGLEGLGAFAALPDATLMRLLSGGDEDDGVGAEALASLSLVAGRFARSRPRPGERRCCGGTARSCSGALRGARRTGTARRRRDAETSGETRRDASSPLSRAKPPVRKNAPSRANATENTPPRIFSDALYSRHLAAHRPLTPRGWRRRPSRSSSAIPDSKPLRDAFVSEYEARGEPVNRRACARWAATHADKPLPWSPTRHSWIHDKTPRSMSTVPRI